MQTFADVFKYITRKNARIIFASPSKEIRKLANTIEGVRSKMSVADSIESARKSLNIYNINIKEGNAESQVLIPLIKDWKKSLEFFLKFFNSKDFDLHLVAVITIPRSVSYFSPLIEMEEKAVLDLAERILGYKNKTQIFKHIIRARSYFEALNEFSVLKKKPVAVLSDNHSYIEKYHDQDNLFMYVSAKTYYPVITSFKEEFDFKPKKILISYMADFKTALKSTCFFLETGKEEIYVPFPIIVPRKYSISDFEIPKEKVEEIKKRCKILFA